MDIWEKLYEQAKKEYHPEDVTPFVYAHVEPEGRCFCLKEWYFAMV